MQFGCTLAVTEIALLLRHRFDALAIDIGLPRSHWRLLLTLAEMEGTNQSRLAEVLAIERITLTHLLDQLEAAALVERRLDTRDRRVNRLFLGPAGSAMLKRMRTVLSELEQEAFGGFTKDAAAELTHLLGQVAGDLAGAAPAPPANVTLPYFAFLR